MVLPPERKAQHPKNVAFPGFFACDVLAYGGQIFMESDFSPKQ